MPASEEIRASWSRQVVQRGREGRCAERKEILGIVLEVRAWREYDTGMTTHHKGEHMPIFDFDYLTDVVAELHESFDPERDVLQAIALEVHDYDANPDAGEGVAYVGELSDLECVALHYAWALVHSDHHRRVYGESEKCWHWESFKLAASENHAFDDGRWALIYWTGQGFYGVQLCDKTRYDELVAYHREEYSDTYDDEGIRIF